MSKQILERGHTATFLSDIIPGSLTLIGSAASYAIMIDGGQVIAGVIPIGAAVSYAIEGKAVTLVNTTVGSSPANMTLSW